LKPATRMVVAKSDKLVASLKEAVRLLRPRIVIETGTYLGEGSTQAILRALDQRQPEIFYTLEVSWKYCEQARSNLSRFPFVRCLWGLSSSKQGAIKFVETDPFLNELDPALDIFVDFLPDPVAGYLNELRGGLGDERDLGAPEGLLAPLLTKHKADRPLICLDSAGGLGWLEFQEVHRELDGSVFGLFLDDINHVKHYRSKLAVERSDEFTVIDSDWEEGWMVAVHGAAAAR